MKTKIILMLVLIISLNYLTLNAQIQCLTDCDKDTLDLMIPNFDKPIPGSSGKLIFCRESINNFTGLVIVKGLSPSTNYILELYSKPNRTGGDKLPDIYQKDRYLDFNTFKTDARGCCSTIFNIQIMTGYYDVKFFIKEMNDTNKWPVVLHNDYLTFNIKVK